MKPLFLLFAGLSLALPQAVLERSPLDRLAQQFPQEFAAVMLEPHLAATWLQMAQTHSVAELERRIAQYTAARPVKAQHYNNRQFATFASDFETVQSARFDNHALRVKKNDPRALGLDTVNQYTGYLDVNDVDKHFFYWFFESRNDPQTDPVILWLNGGPGCLSATGLFFELGPSSINLDMQPVYNPHLWNSNASVIFLDQPVGVGYLYTGGDAVTNTAAAARDVYVFLELFFQKFPHFAANKFHIAGELYAGHYIPSFASEIINQADRLFELASVLIGNGITDPLVQYGSYGPMACGKGGYPQVISDEQCAQLDRQYPQCAALTKLCYDLPGVFTCVPATVYCESMMEPYTSTGLNPYDIRMKCEDSGGNCYKEMDVIDDYLNTEFVKNAVGANVEIFKLCDDTVFRNFLFQGDETMPFQQYVAELLEKNVPVLLYAGDKDYICNWLGNHAWSDALEYSGHAQFARAKLQPWVLHGRRAGEVKNEGIFTFLRIYDAGHMVPYDQPEHALDMVNRWISGDYAMAK
jgi:cathepsin A (carboxypeptidase C)